MFNTPFPLLSQERLRVGELARALGPQGRFACKEWGQGWSEQGNHEVVTDPSLPPLTQGRNCWIPLRGRIVKDSVPPRFSVPKRKRQLSASRAKVGCGKFTFSFLCKNRRFPLYLSGIAAISTIYNLHFTFFVGDSSKEINYIYYYNNIYNLRYFPSNLKNQKCKL